MFLRLVIGHANYFCVFCFYGKCPCMSECYIHSFFSHTFRVGLIFTSKLLLFFLQPLTPMLWKMESWMFCWSSLRHPMLTEPQFLV